MMTSRLSKFSLHNFSWQNSMEPNLIQRDIELIGNAEALPRLNRFIETIGEEMKWPTDVTFAVGLCLEELVLNIVKYGYQHNANPNAKPKINVHLECNPTQVWVTLEDNGVPFNPLTYPEADVSLPLEQRTEGGLGIFLAKKKMDSLDYSRVNDMNRLTLRKNI